MPFETCFELPVGRTCSIDFEDRPRILEVRTRFRIPNGWGTLDPSMDIPEGTLVIITGEPDEVVREVDGVTLTMIRQTCKLA